MSMINIKVHFDKFFIYRGDNARRFILQQPLLYSETAYNYRRLGELWYQLMHSGNKFTLHLL